MIIKSLAELQEADERTLPFNPCPTFEGEGE